MNKWDFLHAIKNDYGLLLQTEEVSAILTDPLTRRSIEIFEESYGTADPNMNDAAASNKEYIVCFSTQHLHIEDKSDAEDYIRRILADDVLPIEFYFGGKRRFGGEIDKAGLARLSPAFLAERFGFSKETLYPFEYEIHSWSGKYDSGRKSVRDLDGK